MAANTDGLPAVCRPFLMFPAEFRLLIYDWADAIVLWRLGATCTQLRSETEGHFFAKAIFKLDWTTNFFFPYRLGFLQMLRLPNTNPLYRKDEEAGYFPTEEPPDISEMEPMDLECSKKIRHLTLSIDMFESVCNCDARVGFTGTCDHKVSFALLRRLFPGLKTVIWFSVRSGWGQCPIDWATLGNPDEVTNFETFMKQTNSVDLVDDDIEAQFFRMPLLSENLRLIWKYYVEANRVFRYAKTLKNVRSLLRGGTSTVKDAMADARKLRKRILPEIEGPGEKTKLWDELATVLANVAEQMKDCRINFGNWEVTPTPDAVLDMVWSSAPWAEDSQAMVEKYPRVKLYGPALGMTRWEFKGDTENRPGEEDNRWQYREI
jgi:hypothetical protein